MKLNLLGLILSLHVCEIEMLSVLSYAGFSITGCGDIRI